MATEKAVSFGQCRQYIWRRSGESGTTDYPFLELAVPKPGRFRMGGASLKSGLKIWLDGPRRQCNLGFDLARNNVTPNQEVAYISFRENWRDRSNTVG